MLNFALLVAAVLVSVSGLYVSGPPTFIFWLALLLVDLIFLSSFAVVSEIMPFGEFSFFVLLFNVVALLVQIADSLTFRMLDRRSLLLAPRIVEYKAVTYIAMAILYLLSLVFYRLSLGELSAIDSNWVEIAASRSRIQLVFINVSVLFFLLFLCFLFELYIKSRSPWCWVILVCAGLLYAALFKAKSILLPVFIPVFVIWFFLGSGKKYQKFLRLSILTIPVYLVYHSIAAFRWVGGLANLNLESFIGSFRASLAIGFEPVLTLQSVEIFKVFYEGEDFFFENGAYAKFLLIPLSYFFDFNIENPMYTYFYILGGEDGAIRGSAHPSIYSDAFATFGWLGLLVGGVWVVFLRALSVSFVVFNRSVFTVFLVTTAYSIPLLARGSVYYGVLYLVVGGLLLAGCYFFFKCIMGLLGALWKATAPIRVRAEANEENYG